MLVPGEFEECFGQWIAATATRTKGEVINFDGKTFRGSGALNASAAHVVTAWSASDQISLGQLRADQKTNEGKVIPELLRMLFIEGCVVTIDAAGCYPPIAQGIVEKKADHVLCVKANQSDPLTAIEHSFALKPPADSSQDLEGDHGRITTRTCTVIVDLILIPNAGQWPLLRSIVRMDTDVDQKATGKKSAMTRYYITTLAPEAKVVAAVARSHWSIENSLHWHLDVSYREDASRKRKDHAAVNFSALTKMTLTMLKRDTSTKVGIKSKRLKAGWDNDYRLTVLALQRRLP